MLIFLKRIIKFAFQNLFREKGTIFPTIFVLFLTVFLPGVFLILKETGSHLIEQIKSKVDISVYFKEEILEEEILKIKEELLKNPSVKSVEYISREEALRRFIQRHKDNPVYMESLEMVGENPFLASLNIISFDVFGYESINQFFDRKEIKEVVSHTSYPKSKIVIEQIFSFISLFKKIGITLLVIFSIVAILVTYNTIKLTILNLKAEIEIQRMIGASNWFIISPFLVQGVIYGILAGIISFSLLGLISWFLAPRMEYFLGGLNLFALFLEKIWILFSLQILVGIFLAIFSTILAINKYLKI